MSDDEEEMDHTGAQAQRITHNQLATALAAAATQNVAAASAPVSTTLLVSCCYCYVVMTTFPLVF